MKIVFIHLCVILEGKADRLISNAWFNKQTSNLYQDLTDADKEELTAQMDPSAVMTSAEVKKRVRRITLNIESKVCTLFFCMYYPLFDNFILQFTELESLGYRGFAVAFGRGSAAVQVAGIPSVIATFTPEMLEYFQALLSLVSQF